MVNIEKLVLDLCAYDDEQEWFEFKENWFQPEVLGEYVSALSNAAAFHYKAQAYFVWGVNDETHEVVGTTFNQYGDYNKEPYRVVVLVIPAAEDPLRVSIFEGETKGSNLFSVREFGNNCLLYTLDEVLRYADVLNYKCSFA